MKTKKWEEKIEQKLCIFLSKEIYKCFFEKTSILISHISLLIYLLPKSYIKRYKRKYLCSLQGETRKLHKIFEDKNLMESVHRKILHTMRSFAWYLKFLHGSILVLHGVRNFFHSFLLSILQLLKLFLILHSHVKFLVARFLLWFSSLHTWLAWQRAMKLQSLDSSCNWASTCFSMDYTKFSLILGLF